MDGLALLCNLFADGPVTLARLRAASIDGLGALAAIEPADLAVWLRASEPQARAFAIEARKLEARLGRERAAAAAPLREAPALATRSAEAAELRPGLVPGLDEHVCARLRASGVRTALALAESAGLALARRTGIPYGRLLELARAVRRPPARSAERFGELAEVELVPQPPRRARTGVEAPARSDGPARPAAESHAAGPFA